MNRIEIVEREHIDLGFVEQEWHRENRLVVCEHIELIATKTGINTGEFQEDLSVFCKECNKIYKFTCEIE